MKKHKSTRIPPRNVPEGIEFHCPAEATVHIWGSGTPPTVGYVDEIRIPAGTHILTVGKPKEETP